MNNTLYAKLKADTGLTALVSTRIYPVEPANDTLLPFLVFTNSAREDYLDLSGVSSLRKYEYIIDYWTVNLDTSQSIATALYSCLQGWRSGSVQGAFRQSEAQQQEDFREGQAFHGQSVYTIYG